MATSITYNGKDFSITGDTSATLIYSVYSGGVDETTDYTVDATIELTTEGTPYFFGDCPLQLKITMGNIHYADDPTYSDAYIEGDYECSVTCVDKESEVEAWIQTVGKTTYVGFSDTILDEIHNYTLTLSWTSLINEDYTASEELVVNTPVYYTVPTISNLTGTSNRGSITCNWNFNAGTNNPIKEYRFEIVAYESEDETSKNLAGGGAAVNLASTLSVTSYTFKDGESGYYYKAELFLTPTYGSSMSLSTDYIPWMSSLQLSVKTAEGWKESGTAFVKTSSGWKAVSNYFVKTSTGWKSP